MTNYYKTLGVKKTATQEEIKTAYKNLVKKYHPDLYQGDKAYAERKTKELNAAYETLSDSELREAYDYELFPPPPGAGYYSSSSDNYSYTPFSSTAKIKKQAGTWAIPDTEEKVHKLKDILKEPLPASEAYDKISDLIFMYFPFLCDL